MDDNINAQVDKLADIMRQPPRTTTTTIKEATMTTNQTKHNVSDAARVFGAAAVSGDARVFGNAEVYGNAMVSGDARVFGDAEVSGRAWVSGNGVVQSQSDIAWIDHVGTFRSITLHRIVKGWQINIRKFDDADEYVGTTIAEVCADVTSDHRGKVVPSALAYLAIAVNRS